MRWPHKLLKMLSYSGDANILGLPCRALNDLDHTFGNLLADIDPERDTHQVSVFELDPWPFVPVV